MEYLISVLKVRKTSDNTHVTIPQEVSDMFKHKAACYRTEKGIEFIPL